jgi:hypothetical protein
VMITGRCGPDWAWIWRRTTRFWAFLGQAYQDIYLAQKDRPEGMGYFDFVMSEVHGLRIKELAG